MIVAWGRHRRSVEAFQPLGVAPLDPEGAGDVIGNVLRAQGDRTQSDQHPASVERDIGHLRAKLDQRHPELALLRRQAGQRRRHRRSDDRANAQVRRTNHIIEVPKRCRIGRDDMNIYPQPVGMEPDRVLDPLDPVDGVERGMGVEHGPLAAVDHRLSATQQLVDIRLLDLMATKVDLDIGDVADQPAGAEARPDVVDRHLAHSLCALDCLAHGDFARGHVGDIAALDPAAFALARAQHAQPPVVVPGDDQRAHL